MRVVVIQMRNPVSGETNYPVTFCEYLSGTNEYAAEPLGKGEIPADLGDRDSGTSLGDLVREYHEAYLDDDKSCAWAAEAIGARLRRLLMEAWNGASIIDSCQNGCATAEADHLRVYFDVEPETLRRLPWELIDDGEVKAFVPATRAGHVSLRGRPDSAALPTAEASPLPINVLVITASDDPDLGAEREVHAIYNALRELPSIWRVHVMRSPEWAEVAAECSDFRPHVLHIIGHRSQDGEVHIHARQNPWQLNAKKLGRLFPAGTPEGRLIFLNSCDSLGILPPTWLSGTNDRAIIVTSGEISSHAAADFATAFYRSLADDGSVVEAMSCGRRVLAVRRAEDWREWGLLQLHSTGSPERVMPRNLKDLRARYRQGAEALRATTEVFGHVDEFRKVWKVGKSTEELKVALVAGATDTGKTTLVKSCLLTWRLDGRTVVYADMARKDGGTVPLSTALVHLRAKLEAVYPDGPTALPAAGIDADDETEGTVMAADVRTLTFLLEKWPSDKPPLLVVIDHAEQITDADHLFVEHFLSPVARRPETNAHVIIVADGPPSPTSDEFRAVSPMLEKDWAYGKLRIDVGLFAGDQLAPSARELLARMDISYSEKLEHYVRSLEGRTRPWPPKELTLKVHYHINLAEMATT